MTNLLIVTSTEFEIEEFLTEHCRKISPSLFEVKNKNTIRILITGMGIANCTLILSKYLSGNNPDQALNIGFCGSFSPEIKPGVLVQIDTDCFAELGVMNTADIITPFRDITENKNILNSLNMYVHPEKKTVFTGANSVCRGITVNTCTGTSERADFFVKNFHAETESMEGAAFFLCCNEFKIPCAQIRAVSNLIPGREPERWDVIKAKASLQALLNNIIF
jgi:futalosine hydrolase